MPVISRFHGIVIKMYLRKSIILLTFTLFVAIVLECFLFRMEKCLKEI